MRDYVAADLASAEEQAEVDLWMVEDDNRVQAADDKRDAADADYQASSQTTQSSSQSSAYSQGCSQESEGGDEDENEASQPSRSSQASQQASQTPRASQGQNNFRRSSIAGGKLDGHRLCLIAQVYKEWKGGDSGLRAIGNNWYRIVKILYDLDERNADAAYCFVREHEVDLLPTRALTESDWTRFQKMAEEEWQDILDTRSDIWA
ncbi:hypothetical protein BD413DRAFT_104435 [Trametes elegans]|nr:hypothetical protein BD413DRAFT_104435 [Trametes elegans]